MLRISQFLLFFIVLSLTTGCVKNNPIVIPPNTDEPSDNFLNKKYTEATFLMTHNAFNASERGYAFPNQTHRIGKQLMNGVRGLMIDTYDGSGGVAQVYHSVDLLGKEPLKDVLTEVKDFLVSYPYEIVTIIFQNEGSNSQLIKAIEDAGLLDYVYVHNGTWPTLKDMINSGQRLVLFTENNKLPKPDYLMPAWGYVFDTPYTFKSTSEFNCNINRGGSGTKELYLVNHWLGSAVGLPDKSQAFKANNKKTVTNRLNTCSTLNSKTVNFLGVDFYEIGSAKAVVDSLNAL